MTMQARLEALGPVVPIVVDYRRGKRLYWAPSRYRSIGAATIGRPTWTLRELARRTGYSVTGLRHALERLRSWGAIAWSSSRGWMGRTRITWSHDVSVARANVPTTVTGDSREKRLTRNVEGTLTQKTLEELPERAPGGGSWQDECRRIAERLGRAG